MASYAGTLKDEKGNSFYPKSANDHKTIGTTSNFFSDLYCTMFARDPNVTGHLALKVGNVKQSNENFMITIKGHFFNYTGATEWEASCYFFNNGQNTVYQTPICRIDNTRIVKDISWATGTDGYTYLLFTNGGQKWNYTAIYVDKVYIAWDTGGYKNLWSGWGVSLVANTSGFTTICTCQHMGDMLAYFPIGSIYMSTSNTNPANFMGGVWEQIQGRFLLGAGNNGDGYTRYVNNTGGEALHTLTINEMPSHRHQYTAEGHEARIPGWVWTSGTDLFSLGTSGYVIDTPGYTGGGQAHNNMPPFYVVYMWKRTG